MAMKSILVGLGNPVMSDDRAGLVVSSKAHRRLTGFDFDLSASGGYDVVDRILGYDLAVIVDSMISGENPPGAVARLDLRTSRSTLRMSSSHGVGFADAIESAERLGAPVPRRILVYGIEVIDPFTVGNEISSAVLERLDDAAMQIAQDILKETMGHRARTGNSYSHS